MPVAGFRSLRVFLAFHIHSGFVMETPPPGRGELQDARTAAASSIGCGNAEEELDVKFLFEEVGAAFGVANILGNVAARFDLKSDRTALKGGAQTQYALAVRMVEAFGDPHDRSKAASDALVVGVENGIGGMMAVGFGLAVVVTDDGGDNVAVAPVQSRNIAVEGEIFAVLVVAAVTNPVPEVVQQGAGLQLDTRRNR